MTDKTEAEQIQETSEEILKEKLQTNVDIVCKGDLQARLDAVDFLISSLKESTSSMTSVPKPMKHLVPDLDQLKNAYNTFSNEQYRLKMADLLSLLSIINIDTSFDILTYRLSSPIKDIGEWGHEYVRCLTLVLTRAYEHPSEFSGTMEQLNPLIDQISKYYMVHNDEPDACDLLLKVDQLEKIEQLTDEESHKRVCTYLLQCYNYLPANQNTMVLKTVQRIYQHHNKIAQSMVVALKMNDHELLHKIFVDCKDENIQNQLAFLLARQLIVFDELQDNDDETDEQADRRDFLSTIATNSTLYERFEAISKSLSKSKARTPDDILQLQNKLGRKSGKDQTKQHLQMAKSFVAGLHNAGIKEDLYYTAPRGEDIIMQTSGNNRAVALASMGMLYLWNIDEGPNKFDKWVQEENNNDPYIIMGALTANGIINAAVRSEFDIALPNIEKYIGKEDDRLQIGAIFCAAIAYAGSGRKDVVKLIKPLITAEGTTARVLSFAALAIGLIYIGTMRSGMMSKLVDKIVNLKDTEIDDKYVPLLSLGLGLIFYGRQNECEAVLEILSSSEPNKVTEFAKVAIITCAYAGTGDVEQIQKLIRLCLSDDKLYHAAAIMGISIIAMGDSISSQMARRLFDHVLQYGKINARLAVPIALALTSISKPLPELVDTLHRIAHDPDTKIVMNSAIALGLLAAGTQNTRAITALKQLEEFHKSNSAAVMLFQISEGLVHLGQGLMTLSPTYGDGLLLHPVALASLMTVSYACIQTESLIVNSDPLLLYFIAPAIGPRYLVTLDEELNLLPLQVRVGTAIDVVGQAGKPRAITGFQTLTTPVILAAGQRAEFVDENVEPLSPILEGFVIVRKRPEKTE